MVDMAPDDNDNLEKLIASVSTGDHKAREQDVVEQFQPTPTATYVSEAARVWIEALIIAWHDLLDGAVLQHITSEDIGIWLNRREGDLLRVVALSQLIEEMGWVAASPAKALVSRSCAIGKMIVVSHKLATFEPADDSLVSVIPTEAWLKGGFKQPRQRSSMRSCRRQ